MHLQQVTIIQKQIATFQLNCDSNRKQDICLSISWISFNANLFFFGCFRLKIEKFLVNTKNLNLVKSFSLDILIF